VSGRHERRPASQGPRRERDRRALRLALAITGAFRVIEAVGGLVSGSLALLADAGHMATDLAGLGLALFALHLAERSPTPGKTYGWQRTEILAALANGTVLCVIAVWIAVEAVRRFAAPPAIATGPMLAVAAAGLVANLLAAGVLRGSSHGSLNLHAAFLHVLTDALGSIGAILAALAILLFDWRVADPLVAVAIAALVLASAWRLLRASVDVLMEGTPEHVDLGVLARAMREVPGVLDVHDVHVWTLTSGYHAMTAHVEVSGGSDGNAVLHELVEIARQRFEIDHTTFQLELRAGDEAASPGCAAEAGSICVPVRAG
jgi:cobalt-zinc-cadmium efflux system protein